METKKIITKLGFAPQENSDNIFVKIYKNNYRITIDLANEQIDYGKKITCEAKTTCNFSQPENFVVLECVNRLLEKGYKPENITLEKTYQLGHKEKGRLDILVKKDDKSFMMIECKTYEREYEDALQKLKKQGDKSQLLSYFQQDKNAEILMLYASKLSKEKIEFKNDIIFVSNEFRKTSNIEELFNYWNKQTISNRNFDDLTVVNKIFTKADLKPITEDFSKKLFNNFAIILRKHSVSDKPNAFNKIFNLFLAKLYDEAKKETDELEFQWKGDNDDAVDFQIRLHNLHQKGLFEFLKREIAGISDSDFAQKTTEEVYQQKKKWLKFNNFFHIKEVLDDETFDENQRVLKDVVELLQPYQIRYPRKQQHLSDFFEQLLTTGLKQEVGQYFTPPPITKFITRSIPVAEMVAQEVNQEVPKLPAMIDYAAGSGHFITEIMEEMQDAIEKLDTKGFFPKAIKAVESWKADPYLWAATYIYGIEKDYRLVKVAKVGCYFYGDGLAQIILGDGLDSLTKPKKNYVGLLSENTNLEDSTKAKFSLVLSNPPYSVDGNKDNLEYLKSQNEFSLYPYLTQNSDDIECLFIERTKQLLKEGGIAAIVLPSSILSNTGIYTKSREIILQYFEIVAITEFENKTFVATGTNTIVLFLKRRSNQDCKNIKDTIKKFCNRCEDIAVKTHNNNLPPQTEKPFSKYVVSVWKTISFDDYISLIKQKPNEAIINHEIYKEYRAKIKVKKEQDFWSKVIELEKEKLLYFILTINTNTVIVKSGSGNTEQKKFLGYSISNSKGNEGIHPIQRGKTIDECTQLFDAEKFDNPQKVSTYIYKAFKKEDFTIDESLKRNVFVCNLVDQLSFNRFNFDKNISTAIKKKVDIESRWNLVRLEEIASITKGVTYSKDEQALSETTNVVLTADNITLDGNFEIKKTVFLNDNFKIAAEKKLRKNDIFMCFSSGSKEHLGKVALIENDTNYYAGGFMGIIRVNSSIKAKYLFQILNLLLRQSIRNFGTGSNINNLSNIINSQKIPLPPLEIQQKIVAEIEQIEAKEKAAKEKIAALKRKIEDKANACYNNYPINKLGQTCFEPMYGANESAVDGNIDIDYRYIRITDITDEGKLNNDWKTAANVDEKYLLKEGDFLFARSGATAGKTFLYKEHFGKALFAGYLIRFIPKSELLDYNFLDFCLKSNNYKNWVLEKRIGTAQPNINAQQFSSFEIPLPPISEQQKIVSKIEKIEQKIAVIENNLKQMTKDKENVLRTALT